MALFELDQNGLLTFSSAELAPNSSLLRSYERDDEVDRGLLESMIRNGELNIKKVVINTNN